MCVLYSMVSINVYSSLLCLSTMTTYSLSASSKVSGRLTPVVSGRINDKAPVRKARVPNVASGIYLLCIAYKYQVSLTDNCTSETVESLFKIPGGLDTYYRVMYYNLINPIYFMIFDSTTMSCRITIDQTRHCSIRSSLTTNGSECS